MILETHHLQILFNRNKLTHFNRPDLISHLLPQFGIDTPQRIAHFMAQVAHESGEFRYRKELMRDKDAERRYGFHRKLGQRLGNTDYGDGAKYKGKGFIQLTGKYNYAKYSMATNIDFVKHPEWLLYDYWALHSACWYWESRGLNELADHAGDDITRITKRINGGLNGYEHRLKYYHRTKKWS